MTTKQTKVEYTRSEAAIQGKYRWYLKRYWDNQIALVFIGLNPSTADVTKDDPTIRRCVSFARRDGYGGIIMLNLFAYRSTDPKVLRTVEDPVGEENNDKTIRSLCRDRTVVLAWGNESSAFIRKRAATVMKMLRAEGPSPRNPFPLWRSKMLCLGKTKNGSPRHPLYVRGSQRFDEYI